MAGSVEFTLFIVAFVLDIAILAFVIVFAKRQGTSGYLSKSMLFAGFSAIALGGHHIMESTLAGMHWGKEIAESFEAVASTLLAISAYYLYKLVAD